MWPSGRLFSHITMNWRGRPLSSHEVVVQTIAATTTRTGLLITGRQMRELLRRHITRHEFHGNWNYDVHPTADDDDEALATPITPIRPNKRQ